MPVNKYLKEVEKQLNTVTTKYTAADVAFLKKYIGTTYKIRGLSVPVQRSVFKKGYSFSSLKPEEQIDIWDSIWNESSSHEVMSQALLFWEKYHTKVNPALAWKHLKNWVGRIDNWAHSDSLSGFYSYLLEVETDMVLPQIIKWNKSKNPWERRQSVVSLTHYHRKREQVLPFSTMITLVENLLHDKDYFVQKGVGWALREIGNAYPKETFAFLIRNYAHLSSVAFAAAAEKLGTKEKEQLKKLRKLSRKKT